jgi:fibro-slime domain-containing protein
MAAKQLVGVMVSSLTLLSAAGCGDSKGSGVNGSDGTGANGTGGGLVLVPVGGSSSTGTGGGGNGGPPGTLPAGFTKADVGGYQLGAPITSDTGSGSAGMPSTNGEGCGTVILAVIRDFKSDHPDFEKSVASEDGLVQPTLGADRKPVFAHDAATSTISGPASFDQWYRNVPDVNLPFVLEVFFAPKNGTTSFQSNAFFPLDGQGFGDQNNNHNFHFTTEIHTQFRYNGGEVFNFTGDDDVWIFINNQLLVDLGGVHGAKSATVDMDLKATEVGIVTGQVYPFDMFQAERHTSESNFRADTNLEFVDCGTIVPDVPK